MEAEMMQLGEDFIEHYGVKGMRWGVRKGSSGDSSSGGKRESKKKRKKKAKELSDDELKTAIARMNLEKQYVNMSKTKVSAGKAFVGGLAVATIKGGVTGYGSEKVKKALQKKIG